MRVIDPLSVYPAWWRTRFGDEMRMLLDDRPPTRRDRVDLGRGALDAWLHPPVPSRVPAVAALVGGGLWTLLATVVALQPVAPDWPGYLLEVVPLAVIAAATLGIATVGAGLRLGDAGGRLAAAIMVAVVIGSVAWTVALIGTFVGAVGPVALAVTQTVAMLGMVGIGSILVRSGDGPVGLLVTGAGLLLLVPWTWGWLAFGAAWTAIGVIESRRRPVDGDRTRSA